MIPQRLDAERSFSHTFGRRSVTVPWPRFEVTQLLVHAIKLGEGFGDQAVGCAVIGEKIVTDAVPARSPQQLVAVAARADCRRSARH